MNKKLPKLLIIIFGILIIHQVYWYNTLDANLIFYVRNYSDDETVELRLYLDDKEVIGDVFTQSQLGKYYPFKISPGRHDLIIKTGDGKIEQKYTFYNLLVTRVIVEYYGGTGVDKDVEFSIVSEFVFGNFVLN